MDLPWMECRLECSRLDFGSEEAVLDKGCCEQVGVASWMVQWMRKREVDFCACNHIQYGCPKLHTSLPWPSR